MQLPSLIRKIKAHVGQLQRSTVQQGVRARHLEAGDSNIKLAKQINQWLPRPQTRGCSAKHKYLATNQ